MGVVLKVLLASAMLLLSPLAYSQSFVEGTHYSIVDDASESNPVKEIVEYFSFSCPGCYALEPHVEALREQLPTMNFRRVHLPFGGRKAGVSQKAFAVLELLDGAQHYQSVFDRIHLEKNVFDSDEELTSFVRGLGYSELQVNQALNSFSADSMLRKMTNEAKKMNIRSVPTMIVNGRYQVNIGSVYSSNNLAALVKYLSGLP
jgi:thiol:disulfide interchange protein DsbA